MLLAGDEMGRTQGGNNNGYCQDSPVSWVDWENAAKYADLADFTAALSALRRAHPVFRRRRFFSGRPAPADPGGLRDIIWLNPSGREMTDADWHGGYARSLAVFLNGEAITERGTRGEPIRDNHFLLLFNAHSDAVQFVLPGADHADGWHVVVDTAAPTEHPALVQAAGCGAARRHGGRRDRPFGHGAPRRRRLRPAEPARPGRLTRPGG